MMGRRIRYATVHYPIVTQICLLLGCVMLYAASFYGYVAIFQSEAHMAKLFLCMISFNVIFMFSMWGMFTTSSNLGEIMEDKRRKKEEYEAGKTGEDKRQ